ncbi:MAG: HDOD domain-containing protein [Proteobacteria bacterium]|nr:HDOD domain-containing protein [Pseudomonadota bacterium]
MKRVNEHRPPLDRPFLLHSAALLGPVSTGAQSLAELISLLCNEQTEVERIVSLIERQPFLAARVLRVANSAYYGHHREVATIQRAVAVLGTQAIRAIAVTCCFDRITVQRLQDTLGEATSFLRHSVATAVAAESLAGAAHLPNREEAFTAGILHNIGVALQACVDSRGIRELDQARRAGSTTAVRDLESAHSSTSHELCGGVVLEAWQLPARLVSVAAHHHEPEEAPAADRPLVALVNIATHLATSCGCGFTLEGRSDFGPQVLQRAQLEIGDLNSVSAGLRERIDEFWHALSSH